MSNPAIVATTTPPDSFTSPPLTPPPSEEKQSCLSISQILSTAKHCQQGSKASCPHTWQRFALQEDEYRDLLQEVAKGSDIFRGFWKHKLRYISFCLTLISRAVGSGCCFTTNFEALTQTRLLPVDVDLCPSHAQRDARAIHRRHHRRNRAQPPNVGVRRRRRRPPLRGLCTADQFAWLC